jgi:hypothetical protein
MEEEDMRLIFKKKDWKLRKKLWKEKKFKERQKKSKFGLLTLYSNASLYFIFHARRGRYMFHVDSLLTDA